MAEKVFVGETERCKRDHRKAEIIHLDVFKKNDKRTIYNVCYKDGATGVSYIKRFNAKDQHTTFASYSKANDYDIAVTGFWNYTKMRSINQFIQKIDVALEMNAINQATRDQMLGEALFARAYCYFAMVRKYGGVPIVTEPLDDKYDGDQNEGLYVPRSTEKETWDFVISELDKAAELLPDEPKGGKYRATKWAALGLQSRVALYAATLSKYWNDATIPSSYKSVQDIILISPSSCSRPQLRGHQAWDAHKNASSPSLQSDLEIPEGHIFGSRSFHLYKK